MLIRFLVLMVLTLPALQASHTALPAALRTDPLFVSEDVAVACLKDLYGPMSTAFRNAREERDYFLGIAQNLARAYDNFSRKYDLEKITTYVKKQSYSPRWLTKEEAENLITKKFPTRSEKERADIFGKLTNEGGRYDSVEIQRESMLAMRQPRKIDAPSASAVRPAQAASPVSAQEQADIDATIAASLATAREQKGRGADAEAAGKEDADARRINGVVLAIPESRLMQQLDAVTNIFDKYQTAIKPGFPKSRTRLNIDANTQTGKITGYHLTLVNVDFPIGTLTVAQSKELERKFNNLVAQIQADKNLEFTFEKFELLPGEPAAAGERSPSYLVAEFKPNAALQKMMTGFIAGLKKEYKDSDIRIRKDIRYHISLVRMSPVIDVEKMIITINQLKNYLSTGRLAGHSSWVEKMSAIDARTRTQDSKMLQQPIPPWVINRGTQFMAEVAPRAKEPLAREKAQ